MNQLYAFREVGLYFGLVFIVGAAWIVVGRILATSASSDKAKNPSRFTIARRREHQPSKQEAAAFAGAPDRVAF